MGAIADVIGRMNFALVSADALVMPAGKVERAAKPHDVSINVNVHPP
jgi:hypothetical protein